MLENILTESFRMSGFRVGQKEIIQAVLDKKDALAVLPTGGGKSLCYQFPAVYLKQLVVVISPLIALMKDQVSALRQQGVPAGGLYSGQTEAERREVFRQMNLGGAFILYLSPERVQKEGFQSWITHRQIALFAVDEAHCVSQWGHDFREEYALLAILKTLRPDVPVLALTASATPTVLNDIAKNLKLVQPERFVRGFYRSNLYYQVETCADEEAKFDWLMQALKQTPTGRVLIYCGTRKITEEVAEFLQQREEVTENHGEKAEFSQTRGEISKSRIGHYHAGLSTELRTQMQNDFASGKIRILAATNAFGMGIDQPDVRLVVHFQMPANIDSLYQEMGRAGRDGEHSTCLMLYSKKDKGLQSFFIQSSKAPGPIKDSRWRNLDALVSYCEAQECRHSEILAYYKDAQRLAQCGHCDVCDTASARKIATPVQPALPAKLILRKTNKGFAGATGGNNSSDDTFINKVASDEMRTRKSKAKAKKEKRYGQPLTPQEEHRFQGLRVWRKAKALELDTPAFIIFGDQTLRDLARKNPQNLEALREVHGIGEFKLEKFGWDLLAELTK